MDRRQLLGTLIAAPLIPAIAKAKPDHRSVTIEGWPDPYSSDVWFSLDANVTLTHLSHPKLGDFNSTQLFSLDDFLEVKRSRSCCDPTPQYWVRVGDWALCFAKYHDVPG